MFQNIKTDVIYHKTATDFEMEFNLCGCCRMRLLTDKTSDNKTFVLNLARAVSRSKIIIITGNLFGDDGIIKITSEAIGKSIEVIDNKQYNINSTEEISVIKGSTPLINTDGYFGGCIIESGPQSMILLSDNKNIRKNIMQTLIHPYINEIYSAEAINDKTNNDTVADAVPTETDSQPEVVAVPQALVEETDGSPQEDNCTEEPEIEAIEEIEFLEDGNSDDNLFIDDNTEESTLENTENSEVDTEENSDIIMTDDMPYEAIEEAPLAIEYDNTYQLIADEEPIDFDNHTIEPIEIENSGLISDEDFIEDTYNRRFKLDLPIMIITIILLALLAILFYFIIYLPVRNGVSVVEYIKHIYNTLFP